MKYDLWEWIFLKSFFFFLTDYNLERRALLTFDSQSIQLLFATEYQGIWASDVLTLFSYSL